MHATLGMVDAAGRSAAPLQWLTQAEAPQQKRWRASDPPPDDADSDDDDEPVKTKVSPACKTAAQQQGEKSCIACAAPAMQADLVHERLAREEEDEGGKEEEDACRGPERL
jgi:hypothetical protein